MKKHTRWFVIVAAILLLVTVAFLPQSEAKRSKEAAKNHSIVGARPPAMQTGSTPVSGQAVGFAETPALRDLPPSSPEQYEKENSIKFTEGESDREVGEKNTEAIRTINSKVKPDQDGALRSQSSQNAPVTPALPAPSLIFDGDTNTDNSTLFGFRLSPPDTNGDVGPNHYVQVINLTLRIFNKTGTSLLGPVKFSSIFAPLGAPCGTRDDGDPIALYDPLANRWMLSQFCLPTGLTAPYHQVIAVSKTPDPTGAYFLYDFNMPNNEFNDYPHFGVWPDGYYMTDNQFLNGGAFDGGGMFAFDRVKMLAGNPTASFIYFNRNLASFPEGQAGMLPADVDGVTPPTVGTPCPFAYFTANEFGDPADGMRIFDFHADFGVPANSTFTERPESAAIPGGGIPVAPFNPLAPTGRDAVPQPPPASATTARLDAISDRLMHRLQYINFGGYESLVVTHTVNVGADQTLANYRAAIRYYQFRKNPGVSPYTVFEQGTFSGAPGDTTHRWMGSAGVNAAGDLAVGFSASSLTVFPSVRYAARFAADPPGSLFQGEQSIFAGTGVQTDTGSRWGDYSSLTLDPSDDCSFWYTQETYTAASQATSAVGWITKIAKLNLGTNCTPFPKGMISGQITDCNTGLPVANATVKTSDGFFTTTDASGNYTLGPMNPNNYNVTATKAGYSTATANGVTVTNGNTTTLNLCINGVAIIGAAGASLVNESCPPTNGAVDPGERVSMNLSLTNTGAGSTTNLVATLQSNAGVVAPSGPQSYGAIPPGGTAGRDFSFTASATCGSNLTLTLQLQDGPTNLGTVTYTVPTGAVGAPTTVSYAGPPVPIPDNVPAGVNIPFIISGIGNIADVNFRIDGSSCNTANPSLTVGVDHSWVGDLTFKLTSPGGTTVSIIQRPGGGTFGSSGNNFCQTLLDDDGAFPSIDSILSSGSPPLGPPYTGTFLPHNPMSAFDGQNADGTWTLNVSDNAAGDTGFVRAFSLIISPRTCTTPCGDVRLVVTSTLTRPTAGTVQASYSVQNIGTTTANNVMLTTAKLGSTNGTPLPQSLGNIAPGGSVASTVIFANSTPGASSTLILGGTYTGGTFSSTKRVTIP
jgi:subtilisin-like proprotein convertase family protein